MDVIWLLTATAGAIAINLIASELFAWGPRLSECLMRSAVRRLAPEMQERMREEWAGHLQTIPPGLWRIAAAMGFYLATRQINAALRVRERQDLAQSLADLRKSIERLRLVIDVERAKSASIKRRLQRVMRGATSMDGDIDRSTFPDQCPARRQPRR